ncbi:hypothetical protein BN1723_020457, partial [Verticillium longisporum]
HPPRPPPRPDLQERVRH